MTVRDDIPRTESTFPKIILTLYPPKVAYVNGEMLHEQSAEMRKFVKNWYEKVYKKYEGQSMFRGGDLCG